MVTFQQDLYPNSKYQALFASFQNSVILCSLDSPSYGKNVRIISPQP